VPSGYHFGWLTQILPFLGQNNLARRFDPSVGLYDPANLTARQFTIDIFICPDDPAAGATRGGTNGVLSSYAACHHHVEAPIDTTNTGVFYLNSKVGDDDIADGLANTIFLGEKGNAVLDLGWASGTRATLRNTDELVNPARAAAASASGVAPPGTSGAGRLPGSLYVGRFDCIHGRGSNFLFGDGSVRRVEYSVDRQVYQRLGHRSDGELVGSGDY
jgi:prepilin-type processing-associated H-X9-DG protein